MAARKPQVGWRHPNAVCRHVQIWICQKNNPNPFTVLHMEKGQSSGQSFLKNSSALKAFINKEETTVRFVRQQWDGKMATVKI